MKQVFRYQPEWLAVVSGILGTLLGGFILWGASGMGWWLGLTLLIVSIYGTAYEVTRENDFISINDEFISFEETRIPVAQIAKIERISVSETIHYKAMLRDGTEAFCPLHIGQPMNVSFGQPYKKYPQRPLTMAIVLPKTQPRLKRLLWVHCHKVRMAHPWTSANGLSLSFK